MTKTMWIAVVILFLLFTGCGIFIFILQQEETEQVSQHFLVKNRIQNNISFQQTGMSLTDELNVKKATIKLNYLPNFNIEIDEIDIHSYTEIQHIASELNMTMHHVRFSLLNLIHSLKIDNDDIIFNLSDFSPANDLWNKPLYALLLAGADQIDATINIKYNYAPLARDMSLQITIDDNYIGKLFVHFKFDDITNAKQGRLLIALKNMLQKNVFEKELSSFLKNTVVIYFDINYVNNGLIDGYKKYVDSLYLRLPGQNSKSELSENTIQSIVKYMLLTNAHRDHNTELINEVAYFIKNPNEITIQSKSGKSINLSSLSGDLKRQLTDFLLKMNVSITTKKSAK